MDEMVASRKRKQRVMAALDPGLRKEWVLFGQLDILSVSGDVREDMTYLSKASMQGSKYERKVAAS